MRANGKEQRGSIWVKLGGWICILLGLLGIVLPIIPGIPLLVVGIFVLSTQHRWARALKLWLGRRFRGIFHHRNGKDASPASVVNGTNRRTRVFWERH